jgi:putative hydrolase of the HAD superfamily
MTRCGASDAIQPELVAITYELAANPVWLMPETRSVFHWLAKHGFRIALVSNAQFYTPLILETLLGRSLTALKIDPRVWSFELGEAKPSPKPFQDLIRQLAAEGIGPGETLYVGNDMLNDIVTAQDQGIRAVLFAGDARSMRLRRGTPRVEGRAPDAVITALSQLPTVIESR